MFTIIPTHTDTNTRTHMISLSLRYAFFRAQPPVDAVQNIQLVSASRSDGLTTISFRRPRLSSDENDISLDECRYFLFGWGGPATVATQSIGYHPTTPIVSQQRICLPSPANCPGGCGIISALQFTSFYLPQAQSLYIILYTCFSTAPPFEPTCEAIANDNQTHFIVTCDTAEGSQTIVGATYSVNGNDMGEGRYIQ